MVHIVMHGEGHVGVPSIDRTGGGVGKMFNRVMATTFQDVHKRHQIAVHIGVGFVSE